MSANELVLVQRYLGIPICLTATGPSCTLQKFKMKNLQGHVNILSVRKNQQSLPRW